MPIKLKANNGNIDLKAPIKQVGGGAVNSVNGMTGNVVLDIPSKTSDLVNDSGFLTQIPDEYITETELDAKGYLTEHQSLADYAKKSEIPDVSGFLTSIPDEYVTEAELDAKGYLTQHHSLENYATKDYVSNALTPYAKTSDIPDVSKFITEIPSEYVTETELDAKGYLTEHQSLSEYAKKSELFSKDYNDLTNKPTIPSVEGLASTQYVDNKVSEIVVPSLEGYATEQWVEGKGYLTQHQSLADYATKSELATKQDTLTAGSNITIENGVISATGGSGGGSYTLPVADYDTLGGVKAKQTDADKEYGIVYIDSDARLRVPIAYQGASRNAGIVLPVNGHFKVDDDGHMYLLPPSFDNIGGVKPDGTTTTVDTDGTIHAVMPEPYTLPTASTTTLGGVKVDDDVIRINENGTLYVDKTKISASNGLPSGGWYPQILMKNSSNNYDSTWSNISDVLAMAGISIGGGGSDWYVTTSTSESNLYNAKEVVIFWQDSNYSRHQSYLNVGCDYSGNSSQTWGSSNWLNTEIKLDSVDSSYNGSSIIYDGSNINTINCTIEAICYKT